MIYTIETDQTLPRALDDVFPFFADAGNLETITPPELRFSIETPRPIEMRVGALIEYRLTLYGIRFRWLTEISVWEPGKRFVDQQILGPFALWHHEHRFSQEGDGTRIQDTVHYALPLDPIGRLAHPLVRKQLDRIFDYRTARVDEILGKPD
jgi:ligand-binding SRPBCC domain-containing protein